MKLRQRLVFLILVLLAFVIMFALDRAAAAQEGGCGLTLWVGGTPVWVEIPCAALTPPASPSPTNTPSATPSATPTASLTPTHTPTPSPSPSATATPSATPTASPTPRPALVEVRNILTSNINLRDRCATSGAILGKLPPGGIGVVNLAVAPVLDAYAWYRVQAGAVSGCMAAAQQVAGVWQWWVLPALPLSGVIPSPTPEGVTPFPDSCTLTPLQGSAGVFDRPGGAEISRLMAGDLVAVRGYQYAADGGLWVHAGADTWLKRWELRRVAGCQGTVIFFGS